MAMAATQDNIEFEKLLNALSSQDAAVRKEAELGFRKLPLQEKVQHLLCNIFDDEQTADMREFNALLLSRCFVSSTAAVRRQIVKLSLIYESAQFPPSLQFLQQCLSLETPQLQLQLDASEGVSRIALAVDRDSLMGDGSTGEQIMQRVMQTHDDEQTEYVLDLLAHIAMICGKQFEQFLPLVMGPVLDKSQHALLSGCDELEEAACEMLLYCFGELKQHYPQQVEHAMQLLLPALKFYFHDYVRSAAAEAMTQLLECGKQQGAESLQRMWLQLGPKLINAISVDPARDVQSELLHTLSQCLALLPPRSLDEQTLQQLLAIVQRFLLAHWQPKLQLCLTDAQYSSEDECSMRGTDSISSLELGDEMNDALDAELQAANEEQVDFDIMPKLIGILHALFGLYKEQFLPHFQQLAPQLLKLLEPARPYPLRCWGLSIFNDLIEHCGTACGKYSEILVAALLQNMQEHEPETSKQAICGCALLAQHGGNQFASAFVLFVPQLMAIVMQPDAQNEANLHITEPAIAAFTQILKHNNKDLGNLDELIAAWFSWLPISKDAKCAQIAYDYMCELFQAQHPQILGEHNFNFPYIVTLIAYAFQLQLILPHSPSGRRMLQVVQQIESDAQAVQRISLSQKQQEALQLAKQQLQVDGVANSLKKI